MILTALVFLLILSILVLVHEFGHFMVARKLGIRVEEFALGLPFTRPLWQRKQKDGMILAVYPVLFGGFVRLLGEDDDSVKNDPRSYSHKKPKQRAAVLVAGVTMNFLLAIGVLYIFLILSGFKTFVPNIVNYQFHISNQSERVLINEVAKNSPAEKAGLVLGDIITAIDGKEVSGQEDVAKTIQEKAGKKITLTIYHQIPLNPKKIFAIPRKVPPKDEGPLGIKLFPVYEVTYPGIFQKLTSGLTLSADWGIYTIKILGFLIGQSFTTHSAKPIIENLSGPVGIFNTISAMLIPGGLEAVLNLLQLLAVMAINLAIVNIFPFPALDGGRLLFVMIEASVGKKIASIWERRVHQVGMAFLLLLMVMITFNDLWRIFADKLRVFFG